MKKNILLIATGGTIASQKSEHGLAPLIQAKEILSYISDVSQFCDPDAIQLCNIDSTNMEPRHWKEMVRAIRDSLQSLFRRIQSGRPGNSHLLHSKSCPADWFWRL